MSNGDCFEGGFDFLVCVESYLVHKTIEALAVELPFDFRENCFYWVELWTVADVEDRLDV